MKTTIEIRGVQSARELCDASTEIRPATKVRTGNAETFLSGHGGVAMDEFDFEPVEIFSIRDCLVLPTGAVIHPKGWVVAETLEGSLRDNGIPENNQMTLEVNAEFNDPLYCTSKFGTFNYSVFFHEILPSIYVAGAHADRAGGFTLGYAKFFPKSRRDKFLELYSPFYAPAAAVDISSLTSLCHEALVVSAGAKRQNMRRIKQVMPDLVSEFALSLDLRSENAPERIYILRERKSIRELENREQVIQWAGENGFVCIELADLSFSAQASFFRNASIVFAEHGAGLANLWHCRKGVRVFEVFPDKLWGRWLYRAVAALSSLDYVATAIETPKDWVWNRDAITLPLDVLDSGLLQVERGIRVSN